MTTPIDRMTRCKDCLFWVVSEFAKNRPEHLRFSPSEPNSAENWKRYCEKYPFDRGTCRAATPSSSKDSSHRIWPETQADDGCYGGRSRLAAGMTEPEKDAPPPAS